MDIHKNARLTLRSREALVQRVARGMALKAAAAAFNVTPKTATKWVHRYRAVGSAGLLDRSSRPAHSPRRTPSFLVARVVRMRRHHRPAYQIAQATGLSAATVSRILQRFHLNRWRDLHPAAPTVRYEHPAPGDLLHLDIKGMTRLQHTVRGDGRLRGRPRFAGWEALHIAIDDHSRLAFSMSLPDPKAETSPDRTPHAPTVRPNASSRPRCANGPTHAITHPPKNATSNSPPGCDTTTSLVPMVVSASLHPLAALLPQVQPREKPQVPRVFFRRMCKHRMN